MNWDTFTFFIMGIIFFGLIALIFFLGDAPGKIARERGHPQADAINCCAWIGLFTVGVMWVIALVWAYSRPVGIQVSAAPDAVDPTDAVALQRRIANLSTEIGSLQTALAKLQADEQGKGQTS